MRPDSHLFLRESHRRPAAHLTTLLLEALQTVRRCARATAATTRGAVARCDQHALGSLWQPCRAIAAPGRLVALRVSTDLLTLQTGLALWAMAVAAMAVVALLKLRAC